MSNLKIISHFTEPQWPMVNKLTTIAKSLSVEQVHCATIEKVKNVFSASSAQQKILFISDEGCIELVKELESKQYTSAFGTVLFITSKIVDLAKDVQGLKSVKYLLGVNRGDIVGRDLTILIKKFQLGDILDLEKYLSFGASITRHQISTDVDKKQAIEGIYNFIASFGGEGYPHPYAEYARRIAEMVDELLLNAIFNANPRLKGVNRALPFSLSPDESVHLAYGYDGDLFGVSVKDPFGVFTKDTVLQYLSAQRSLQSVTSGASGGLGIRFVFERAHHVIANVKKEVATEIISLIQFDSRLSNFDKKQRSFYFFSDED
jgi:hypothetical protein